jgi:HPt (histidine-containing phosphotransfer) domain-containing protein
MFLVEGPHWSNELRQALAAGDLVKARRLAHNLKSSAGHFAATTAAEAALRVEKLAGEGDLAGALAACPTMEREMAQLRQALLALPALLPVPTST